MLVWWKARGGMVRIRGGGGGGGGGGELREMDYTGLAACWSRQHHQDSDNRSFCLPSLPLHT